MREAHGVARYAVVDCRLAVARLRVRRRVRGEQDGDRVNLVLTRRQTERRLLRSGGELDVRFRL